VRELSSERAELFVLRAGETALCAGKVVGSRSGESCTGGPGKDTTSPSCVRFTPEEGDNSVEEPAI
jgi:hypothetical protein